jgi:predicted protein tyrosine phosphatase
MITVQIEVTRGKQVEFVQTFREDRRPMTKCYDHISPSSARRLAAALVTARTTSIRKLGDRTDRVTKVIA